MGAQAMSRRDVLKFSALGAAAVALPLERMVRAKTVSQIAASKLPAPYTLPFAVPPVIDGRAGAAVVTLEQTAKQVSILPGFQTTIFGYDCRQGRPPRPDDPRPARHAAHGDAGQQAAGDAPVPQLRPVDLDAPARLGVEAAVRRVRQRHHQGRPDQALRLPEQAGRAGRSGTTTTACTTPPRTPTWAWPRSTTCTTTSRRAGIPMWPTAADQYDLPLILADKMFSANGEFRYDDAGHTGPLGRRRSWSTACRGRTSRSRSGSTASGCSMPRSPAATGCS